MDEQAAAPTTTSPPPPPPAVAAAVVLVVPERHVQAVKCALENFGHLDRNTKIAASLPENGPMPALPGSATEAPFAARFPVLTFDPVSGRYVDPAVLATGSKEKADFTQKSMRIPTTIPYTLEAGVLDDAVREEHDKQLRFNILDNLLLSHLFQEIRLTYQVLTPAEAASMVHRNPVQKALKEALERLPDSTHSLASLGLSSNLLVSSFPNSYSVYKPLLLLPHNAFSSKPWNTLLSVHQLNSDYLQPIWRHIANAVGATHLAVNAPIPQHTAPVPDQQECERTGQQNILRSPIHLTPLHGDFGPSLTSQALTCPTDLDFTSHFWVTTTQNGIRQTWAPRFTMFSRGNLGEKTRILNMPSVTTDSVYPSAAADLYAGIGYFAFSYKKAGKSEGRRAIEKVLCWELNPWSVEGLRRGAEMNGWTCVIFTEDDVAKSNEAALQTKLRQSKDVDFWVFQMSNEHAERVVRSISEQEQLGLPIRHINLGLLPTSAPSWPSAIRILDAEQGGWIHVHENVGVGDIESRAKEVEIAFQELLKGSGKRRASIEHIEKVKMYAPGVMHVVFDVRVTNVGSECDLK